MPSAIARSIREDIVRQHKGGTSLAELAHRHTVAYRTVRRIWHVYVTQGRAGLKTGYSQCGRRGYQFETDVCETALTLKREHPRWGAGLIRVETRRRHPRSRVPAERTLQYWFRTQGLQGIRKRHQRSQPYPRAKSPHAVWEMDAKEQIRLQDGTWTSVVSAQDECSGAVLNARAFPPPLLGPGLSAGRASVVARLLRMLGTPSNDPG